MTSKPTKLHAHDVIVILGRRGCGKSHLSKKLQTAWPRRIIFDATGEYRSEFRKENPIRVYSFEQYRKTLIELYEKKANKFILIVELGPGRDPRAATETFNEMLKLAYYFENVQLVIEEVQVHTGPHGMPSWLRESLLTGRHRGLSLLFTTLRPGELHKTIYSQAAHLFLGQITEGNDLRYLKGTVGDAAERLPHLPKRRFLWKSDAGIFEISNDF